MGLKEVLRTVGNFADKNAPEILKGIGISGTITSLVMAIKSTPRALEAIEREKARKGESKLTTWETIKCAGKYYIPCIATEILSLGCFAVGDHIGHKRTAALAAAYAISENALKSYTEKVIEVIGDKKELAVRSAVDKDIIAANPISKTEVVVTNHGKNLCFDATSSRYFLSSKQKIDDSVNIINKNLRDEMYIPLNEFYYLLGLESADCGDLLGWNIDKGYLVIKYTTQIAEDGTPALVLNYKDTLSPKYDYR